MDKGSHVLRLGFAAMDSAPMLAPDYQCPKKRLRRSGMHEVRNRQLSLSGRRTRKLSQSKRGLKRDFE